MIYAHISDLHLALPGKGMLGIETSFIQLEAVFCDMKYRRIKPNVLLISGDICFRADTDCYEKARKVIEKYAVDFGVPVVIALGNHDNGQSFRKGYLGQSGGQEPYYGETQVDGLRILTLDTRMATEEEPYHSIGYVTCGQLDWPRKKLAYRYNGDTLLLLHHPPALIPTEDRTLIENVCELQQVIRDAGLMGILCGHTHEPSVTLLDGVLCSVAPATSNGRITNKNTGAITLTSDSGYNVGYITGTQLAIQTIFVQRERNNDITLSLTEIQRVFQNTV